MSAKRLIEVAMPIKEVSAESVRDKSIRHGHISTLHLWWARRPLPVCRAVVFASLVPDPLDAECPKAFKDAVAGLLAEKAYKPYEDIPFTPAVDPMEDNLRNRLLMFIGKFSDDFVRAERQGKTVSSGEQISDASLIKWESKNNEKILRIARTLIWVAHNSEGNNKALDQLSEDFAKHYDAIVRAEKELYSTSNRHLLTREIKKKEELLHAAIEAFLDRMPKVFDPFAGGGAIPLEAARLGCRSYANDINPVAHIIQKGSIEFPQKYGKPILFSTNEFVKLYGKNELESAHTKGYVFGDQISIPNRLLFDVEYFSRKLLELTEREIGYLYPADKKGNKPVAYYWVRTGVCSNPKCKSEIPLLKQFYLAYTPAKKIHLKPIIKGKKISFEIGSGEIDEAGWIEKGNLKCPICQSITSATSIRNQFKDGLVNERLVAVIEESSTVKQYRLPREDEHRIITQEGVNVHRGNEILPKAFTGGSVIAWGLTKWSDLFSNRQHYFLETLINNLSKIKKDLEIPDKEYQKALMTYLSIFFDRMLPVSTSYGRWNVRGEKIESPFSKQAIPFVFDSPESNPFCNSTGSANNQIEWILRYIASESSSPFACICNNASSGEKNQFPPKSLKVVVTDPPYYDAIAYADLSDFFYSWLKKSLVDVFPLNFATPQSPKSDECTALRHHHDDDNGRAKEHFENKLRQIFESIEYQTSDLVSIMFAHQGTEAWTTLCNSILNARMNITGSWAIDTEMTSRSLALVSATLESSVTVSCRPTIKHGVSSYRDVRREIEKNVKKEIHELYALGFRGADLLTACFGQAVGEFGKYERVEKADGSEVMVAELLEMARESAFNAIISDISTDDYSRFYIGWLNLFGFSPADHDDVRRITQIGLNIDVGELTNNHILIRNGNKQNLASYDIRITKDSKLGEQANSFDIDKAHKAMHLFKGSNRAKLTTFLAENAPKSDHSFWRVLTSLAEVLPRGTDDYTQAEGLLTNKESLLRDAKAKIIAAGKQEEIF
jgi:putative DNA methylase